MKKADLIKILIGVIVALNTAFQTFRQDATNDKIDRNYTELKAHINISNANFNHVREMYVLKKDHLAYHRGR